MMKFTVLDPPLEPGEGMLMNIVADYSYQYRICSDKSEWSFLVNYLNNDDISESARLLGLYMIGELSAFETSEMIAGVGDWYQLASENEKKNSKRLFGV